MSSESGKQHILVFPYPAQGHMIPIIDFTHRLALAGGRRLSITVLVTTSNVTFLRPLLAAHPSVVTPLVLPFPSHPHIPPGVENTSQIGASAFGFFIQALAELQDPLLLWFLSHPSPPVAIISDTFLGWTHHLAAEIGVPRYAFCSTGAFFFSTSHHLWNEMPMRKDASDESELVAMGKIPNSPVFPWKHLSAAYRSYVAGDKVSELLKDSFRANSRCHGIIINTFMGLEGIYMGHLAKELGHNRVWAVGPVFTVENKRGGPSSIPPNEISSWLDTFHDRTVVYICFGSQHVLADKQMEVLTTALCNSHVKFILATKGHVDGPYLPMLEDRTAGRGIVIRGWAPQVTILNHKAVGAFMSHCGWNSTTESIAAGVPMLAFPMSADQFVNTALLVDQLDVAVRVCDPEEEAELDPIALCQFLVDATSEKWAGRRARTSALSAAALAAVKEGGTSFNDEAAFLRELGIGSEQTLEERSSS